MKLLSSNPEVEKQHSPPRVTLAQWLLAFVSVLMGGYSYYITDYDYLAILALILAAVNFVLVVLVAKEALNSRLIGKFCLMAGALVFYWVDAASLALQKIPFTIPNGFPVQGEQFDPRLIQQALLYITLFQFCLLLGYSIRPRLHRVVSFFRSRMDGTSFDRRIVAYALVVCSLLPLLIYYDFDIATIIKVMLAGRAATDFETPEPGLSQHLALFGIYGAALFFVYALKTRTWRRFWLLILGASAALPFIMGGARHIWLYISLPSVLIVLRGFKGQLDRYRIVALTAAALLVLVVAQVQFSYRTEGWKDMSNLPKEDLSQINTNGQLTALLFAEHLVPNDHDYFMELAEPYFIIHWIPRQLWPTKPIMESWTYYNESYVEGAAFNVTPSVIGQFYINWGPSGVIFIGLWLGFLTVLVDRVFLLLDSDRQRAMFVAGGMFYAFIISSFRFYSPIYFSYFLFGFVAMLALTSRPRLSSLTDALSSRFNRGVTLGRSA